MNPSHKAVRAIYTAGYTDYDGLDTWRVMPTRNVPIEVLEPFIFLNHHGPQSYPANNPGLPFGPHPHKGFETVTFILNGELVHQDSTGFQSNILEGGVQWMTAGSGIIHSETSSESFREMGGAVEILQLWVNLPARLKNSQPNYIGLQKNELPDKTFLDGKGIITPVSGTWENVPGPIQSLSDVHLATVHLSKEAAWPFIVLPNRTVLYYVVRGKVVVNGSEALEHDLVEFEREGSVIHTTAAADTILMVGHAAPNREPIAAHGPFVMNTHEEIREAFVAYQEGAFGQWQD